MRLEYLERAACLVTWAVVTGFAAWLVGKGAVDAGAPPPVLAGIALVHLASTWATMSDAPPFAAHKRTALWLQLAFALGLGWLVPVSFLPIYTIIWIAMAASLYAFSTSLWLLVAVLALWYFVIRVGWDEADALIHVVLFGTFHLFALLTARNAHEAEAARAEVESLNRELVATQHLLSEASRQAERTRIARDLHDLLGHHLTALSLNLQIAERLSAGEAKDKVGECRALARLLLADVREAVSTLRTESPVDFAKSLRLLVDNAPQLDVRLDIEDGLGIDDVEVAETLLRCVQEAITNTLRHSGASTCWIRVWREQGRLHLDVRDDGRVDGNVDEGHGLSGMRERLARVRGSLELGRAEDALRLHVVVPLPG